MTHRLRALAAALLATLLLVAPVTARAQYPSQGGEQVWSAFAPVGSTVPLAVGTTSASVPLPGPGPNAWVCNLGSQVAYAALGSNAAVATTGSFPIAAYQCDALQVRSGVYLSAYLAAVTAAGATELSISTGTGGPAPVPLAPPPLAAVRAVGTDDLVVASGPTALVEYTVEAPSTGGPYWAMVFDAATLPANGATGSSLVHCHEIGAGGWVSYDADQTPEEYVNGVVLALSSTSCATLTVTAASFMRGRAR